MAPVMRVQEMPPKQKCTLSVDYGSSSIRASLLKETKHGGVEEIVVKNLEHVVDGSLAGNFPSYCCPFALKPLDDEYLGHKAMGKVGNVPSKTLLAAMSGARDSILMKSPFGMVIVKRMEDPKFRQTVEQIPRKLLRGVRTRIDDVCQENNLEYDRIVLTIPPHWNWPELQDVYVSIVAEVFEFQEREDRIITTTEIEGLVHYLLWMRPELLEDWDFVLFLDFGGLSAGLCGISVESMRSKFAFLELPELPECGVAGGSELFNHLIAEKLRDSLRNCPVGDPEEHRVWVLQKQFGILKKDGSYFTEGFQDMSVSCQFPPPEVCLRTGEKPGHIEVTLGKEDVEDCFKKAFEAPIKKAQEYLRKLRAIGTRVGVVVSGGSLRPKHFCNVLFTGTPFAADDHSSVLYTSEKSFTYDSNVVCGGAARAMCKSISVGEAFNDGAGIGVQSGTNTRTGTDWHDDVQILHSKRGTREALFSVLERGSISIRLVYDPFYAERPEHDCNPSGNPTISCCYDFYEIGVLNLPGYYRVYSYLQEDKYGEYVFNVRVERQDEMSRGKWRLAGGPFPLPLYYHEPQRVVKVDIDKMPEDMRPRRRAHPDLEIDCAGTTETRPVDLMALRSGGEMDEGVNSHSESPPSDGNCELGDLSWRDGDFTSGHGRKEVIHVRHEDESYLDYDGSDNSSVGGSDPDYDGSDNSSVGGSDLDYVGSDSLGLGDSDSDYDGSESLSVRGPDIDYDGSDTLSVGDSDPDYEGSDNSSVGRSQPVKYEVFSDADVVESDVFDGVEVVGTDIGGRPTPDLEPTRESESSVNRDIHTPTSGSLGVGCTREITPLLTNEPLIAGMEESETHQSPPRVPNHPLAHFANEVLNYERFELAKSNDPPDDDDPDMLTQNQDEIRTNWELARARREMLEKLADSPAKENGRKREKVVEDEERSRKLPRLEPMIRAWPMELAQMDEEWRREGKKQKEGEVRRTLSGKPLLRDYGRGRTMRSESRSRGEEIGQEEERRQREEERQREEREEERRARAGEWQKEDRRRRAAEWQKLLN